MEVCVCSDKSLTGRLAAEHGASVIQDALKRKGKCNVVLATGASQFEVRPRGSSFSPYLPKDIVICDRC